ncbi:MAG: glucosidase [Planctomycetaceae bacterium]|nr:glucosidase [Planctomycetaceae bacterium]
MFSEHLSNAERLRLEREARRDPGENWKRWGPYLSERQWGTVREDYSSNGQPWDYFKHDDARSRAYRWGEDGLLGISDRQCRLCFALALWNTKDPILKERLFGVGGTEGNHGEDVKEFYFYLDSTPTHSYMKALYKYPQCEFPYDRLAQEGRIRGQHLPEFELPDTGIFDENRYFDVFAEYAKASPNNILIQITVHNRGPKAATLHVLPTLWFRNTWSWGTGFEGQWKKPNLRLHADGYVEASHETLGEFQFAADASSCGVKPDWLFTENDSSAKYHADAGQAPRFAKDAFHEYVVHRKKRAVNSRQTGTKAAAHYVMEIPAGGQTVLKLQLWAEDEPPPQLFGKPFSFTMNQRISEADAFYAQKIPAGMPEDAVQTMRQAYAGLMWTKQFYNYSVYHWLKGDPDMPPPPAHRKHIRNGDWPHLYNRDIISMPDKWEYPWYAAWDSAFHMIPFGHVDTEYAKEQLILFLREWYMHPNGQIPAYEWNFSDVNPPVHAWACWHVYKRTGEVNGQRDRQFLARTFQKLLLNFTWWVNRKDVLGKHVFSGGFLGLDNIGVFDRSKPLPTGGHLHQADGTAWMGFFCSNMLTIALELAAENPAYADMASKFFEHYIEIADAMNSEGTNGLWNEEDGFYYDHLYDNGHALPLRVRSMVGIIPLFTATVIDDVVLQRLPGFRKRMNWFIRNRRDQLQNLTYMERDCDEADAPGGSRLLAIPSRERLLRILAYVLDENEFLSPYGIRSLSKIHAEQPFVLHAGGHEHRVSYLPGESDSWMFGGNSNWRGPIWFPVNYLLIEALERYHRFYGDTLKVECPTGSGTLMNLGEVARELMTRQVRLFLRQSTGDRPCHGSDPRFRDDPHWKDLVLFYEYFHAETGKGLGASHQTGWTALAARLLEKLYQSGGGTKSGRKSPDQT